MKLSPTRPVTIEKAAYGERWFPNFLRHPSGLLLLHTAYGHDTHFTPNMRLQSADNGINWACPTDNIPRHAVTGFFNDGSMVEMDTYGICDPKNPTTSHRHAAWSNPILPSAPVKKGHAVFHAPGCRAIPLKTFQSVSAYPTFPWWEIWNGLFKRDDMTNEDIKLNGPDPTTLITLPDGRLYCQAYWWPSFTTDAKMATWGYISSDQGHTWHEQGLVGQAPDSPEGCNESTVTVLKDGRLYSVVRTGLHLVHTWSNDLGKTWTPIAHVPVIDEPGYKPGMVWPVLTQLENGTLVLVYGRHGKNIMVDPTGTGTAWQARLDLHAWELDTQTLMGVPKDLQLRGPTQLGVRYWDSGDYLGVLPNGPDEVLVVYDVQGYIEHWNAKHYSGIRMVKVKIHA